MIVFHVFRPVDHRWEVWRVTDGGREHWSGTYRMMRDAQDAAYRDALRVLEHCRLWARR